jgi:hypothetical protein
MKKRRGYRAFAALVLQRITGIATNVPSAAGRGAFLAKHDFAASSPG